jgi:DNA-binding FadR family transcriptional regulator
MARIGLAVDVGLLAPGERLPCVDDLATTFGVAAITVRRTLKALVERGILVARRGRNGGTFVAASIPERALAEFRSYRIGSAELADLLDHRALLEAGAAYVAADRATKSDVAELRAMVASMAEAPTWAAFRAVDPSFHIRLASIAGSQRTVDELVRTLQGLIPHYMPYPIAYLRQSNEEHARLVDAIERGDGAEAAALARAHTEALRDTVFVRGGQRRAGSDLN